MFFGGAAKRRGRCGPVLFTPPDSLTGKRGGKTSEQLYFDIMFSLLA
jgi:hypothetical protein